MFSSYLPIGWTDLLDVLAVSVVLWVLLVWLRQARARLALVGVSIAGGLYFLARMLSLELTAGVFEAFFTVLVIVLVVVFQEDLRRLFERIAVWGLRRRTSLPPPSVSDLLVRVASHLAEAHTGALIVIPGREPLERHLEGGIALDAAASEPLLLSIFDSSSPGHDGAVLISGDRVARFAVHLPLSTNQAALRGGGTRHAAALGLAERADCLCIVVSEERGRVSVARDGHLRVLRQPRDLMASLQDFEAGTAPAPGAGGDWRAVARRWPEAVVAVLLAAGLWVARVPGATVAQVVRTAPVMVEKLPGEYELESVEPDEVQVTLRGVRRDLFFRAGEEPRVKIDALLVKLGRRTFEVSPELVDAPAGLEVVSVEPDRVRLSVLKAEEQNSE